MAQHDYIIANQSGASFRADLNDALSAIVTNNSGATAPTTTYAYQWWPDTTTGLLKIRNAANSAWITVGTLASTNLGLLPNTGGTLTGDVTLNAQSDLRFADSDSSNWVAFQAPATVTSNVTWTLPSADGTNGQKLSTNGSGTLSWTPSTPNIVYLTTGTSATYTPTTGTKSIYVEVVGGGGGGGGVDGVAGTGSSAAGGGGSGGGYAAKMITNMSQTFTYTIGAGGSGGAAGPNDGSNGGSTIFLPSVDAQITGSWGFGGVGVTATATDIRFDSDVAGGNGSGGDIAISGTPGVGNARGLSNYMCGGRGGSSVLGTGAYGRSSGTGAGIAGVNATQYGGGGSGASTNNNATNYAGGDGFKGVIRITEYF